MVEAQEFDTSLGPTAMVTETNEHFQLLRWRFEMPSELDAQSATEWRQAIKSVDLEKAKAQLKKTYPEIPHVASLTALGDVVDALLRVGDQRALLEMCLEDAHLDDGLRAEIRTRWERTKDQALRSFAPYAYFCFRIRMLFHCALANDLVSTKSSNTADLVYLYYAPFCKLLSSNDKLHVALAPLVLRPDQQFVRTDSLRADLGAIAYFWDSLSTEHKGMWFDRFGHWPPRNQGSVTYRAWSENMRMPGTVRGNLIRKMSPAALAKQEERVKEVMQAFREVQQQIRKGP
jgi:hypothetical protein